MRGKAPVDSWYSEGQRHVYGREPASTDTGHFTQLVWAESRELGIGKAVAASGKVIVVGNYDPPGNFIGQYAKNVLPPIE